MFLQSFGSNWILHTCDNIPSPSWICIAFTAQVISINASANQWDRDKQSFGKVISTQSAFPTDMYLEVPSRSKWVGEPDYVCHIWAKKKILMLKTWHLLSLFSGLHPWSKVTGQKEDLSQLSHQVFGEEQAMPMMMMGLLMILVNLTCFFLIKIRGCPYIT